MHAEAALLNDDFRPYARDKRLLSDDFASALHQRNQNVECPASDLNRLVRT
jgi:hypothetical protein